MKSYSINYSDEAISDLKGIFEYISFELQSPDNAKGQVDRIRDAIYGLGAFPKRNPVVQREPWKSLELRRINVDSYAVLYYVSDERMSVDIARIPYGGRNIDRFLEDNLG